MNLFKINKLYFFEIETKPLKCLKRKTEEKNEIKNVKRKNKLKRTLARVENAQLFFYFNWTYDVTSIIAEKK